MYVFTRVSGSSGGLMHQAAITIARGGGGGGAAAAKGANKGRGSEAPS